MKEIFNEHFRFLGNLVSDSFSLENVVCELDVNHFDPRNMSVKVIPTQGSIIFILAALKDRADIEIRSKGLRNEIILEVDSPNIKIDSKSGQSVIFNVFKYTNTINYSEEKNHDSIKFNITIPDSALFNRERTITKHYTKGLLAGWKEINKNHSISEVWDEEIYSFKSKYGYLNVVPTFLFGELKDNDLGEGALLAIEQINIYLKIKSNRYIKFDAEKIVIEIIEKFLKIVSFLEGDILQWREISIIFKVKGRSFREKLILQRSRDKNENLKIITHYKKHRRQYHIMIQKLFNSYSILNGAEKNEIDKILERFILSCTKDVLETQIIYWHSCLDVITKYMKAIGRSFSHKVVDCCIRSKIEWNDLYPEITVKSLEDKKEFLINRARNDMLHHGVYPTDYDLIFLELRKTRALCERLICKILNVDYKDTGIGILQI